MSNKDEIRPTKLDIFLISIVFAATIFLGFSAVVIFADALK